MNKLNSPWVGSGRAALMFVLALTGSVYGLDVTFDSGAGVLLIVDQGAGDLNAAVGTIDFAPAAVGGIFLPAGRVEELIGGPVKILRLTATPPAANGTFRNVDPALAPHVFTVTFNSSPFPAIAPPVAWTVSYDGLANDPGPPPPGTGGVVEIPTNQASGWLNAGAVFLATVAGPVIFPPVAVPPPVPIGPAPAAGVAGVPCTSLRGQLLFDPRAGDQIELPASVEVTAQAVAAEIPTVTEWGLIVLTLLLLTAGAVVIARRQAAVAGAGGMELSLPRPRWDANLFGKALAAALTVALAGLLIAFCVTGKLATRDVVGILICAGLAAYLVHLWIATNRDSNRGQR